MTRQPRCKVREVRLRDLGPVLCPVLKPGSEMPFHVQSSLQESFWRKFGTKRAKVHVLLHKLHCASQILAYLPAQPGEGFPKSCLN